MSYETTSFTGIDHVTHDCSTGAMPTTHHSEREWKANGVGQEVTGSGKVFCDVLTNLLCWFSDPRCRRDCALTHPSLWGVLWGPSAKPLLAIGNVPKKMAGTTGLEPAASAVTGQRSNQLNYVPLLKQRDRNCQAMRSNCVWLQACSAGTERH